MRKDYITEPRARVILALANNGMNVSRAARELWMHRNNVAHHMERIKEITGKDPRNFYDLVELVTMVRKMEAEHEQT